MTQLAKVVPFRWVAILCWVGVMGEISAIWPGDGDWAFFRTGARALFGLGTPGVPGGIHLYASLPATQIGPPALLVAFPLTWLPRPWDLGVARVLMGLALLLVLWLLDRLCQTMGVSKERRQRGVLLGGLMLFPAWVIVAVDFAHLDDVMVLVLGVLAMLLVAKERPMWAATAIGVAVACKPWGIVMAPVLLQSGWRPALRPVALSAAVALAWWVPFLSDPHTLTGLWGFRLPVNHGSGLSALGLAPSGPMPGWVRPAQLIGGALLGVVVARRGNWTGVLLVGLAIRVALDPNPMLYYGIGPVLGALVWDLTRPTTGIPWTTGVAMAAFSLTPNVGDPHAIAVLRLATCVCLILSVLLRRPPRPLPIRATPEAVHAVPALV